jgi:uncharacterized repeat protein (TIGR03943 family)
VSSRELTKRAIVLAAVAAGLGRLVVTDTYLAYVKPGMRIPLAISVFVMAVLALASASFADRDRDLDLDDHDHDHDGNHDDHAVDDDDGHDHGRFPLVGWWLLAPVVCIALVPLVPLGADAVDGREANAVSASRAAAVDDSGEQDADRVEGGELTMLEFVDRAINDPSNPFPEPVTLTGFVSEDPAITDGFVLSRFVMSCCAADALPLSVHVRWYEDPPAVGEWVTVTGTQVPAPDDLPDAERPLTENIVLEADAVEPIDQPAEPYESL